MPRARITHQWVDGAATVTEVYVEPSFPDSVDEARSQCERMWRATCMDVEPDVEYIGPDDEAGE